MLLLGLIELPVWLAILIGLLFTICCYSWHKQRFFTRLGIKTKRTNFFIGDLPTIIKTGLAYIDYEMVKENGKVFGIFVGNVPTLVINDPDMLKQILVKNFSNFSNRVNNFKVEKECENAILLATDNHWKFLRSVMSPTFSGGKLRNMCPMIRTCLQNLDDFLNEQVSTCPDGVDMSKIFNGFTMGVIISTSFGMDVNALRNPDTQFVKSLNRFINFNPGHISIILSVLFPDLAPLFPRVPLLPKDEFKYLQSVIMDIFEDRKKESSQQKDLAQLLINAQKDKTLHQEDDGSLESFKERGLTDEELLINSIFLVTAGFDTTATALSWLLLELVLHPYWMSQLVDEIEDKLEGAPPDYDNVSKLPLLEMVVKETLRLHPPLARTNREAKEDIEINGVRIPKGLDVTFVPLALHYDPDYWQNPTEFDPHRFSPENQHLINEYAYLPFGIGPRHCIGMRLAVLEVKMTLVFLLQKYHFARSDQLAVPMPCDKRVFLKLGKPLLLHVKRRLPKSQ